MAFARFWLNFWYFEAKNLSIMIIILGKKILIVVVRAKIASCQEKRVRNFSIYKILLRFRILKLRVAIY